MIDQMISAALREQAGAIRTWVRDELRQRFGRFVLRSIISAAQDKTGLTDVIEGYGSEQENDPARMDARRVEAPGFLCIPLAKGAALVLCNGANSPYWPMTDGRYRPQDGKGGEFCVYTLADADKQVRLWGRDTGNATLEPGTAGKVYLGTAKPAEADPVALYTQLKADYDALVSKYNNHTHPAPGGTTFAVVAAFVASDLSASVASSNVQAKK